MGEHIFVCPHCGGDVDAGVKENQNGPRISYVCPHCKSLTAKYLALRLMEKRDGRKRWSIRNFLDDGVDPFTGYPLVTVGIVVEDARVRRLLEPMAKDCDYGKSSAELELHLRGERRIPGISPVLFNVDRPRTEKKEG
jgi:hypothetical protein